jgi:anti-sigma-K factor RskA
MPSNDSDELESASVMEMEETRRTAEAALAQVADLRATVTGLVEQLANIAEEIDRLEKRVEFHLARISARQGPPS